MYIYIYILSSATSRRRKILSEDGDNQRITTQPPVQPDSNNLLENSFFATGRNSPPIIKRIPVPRIIVSRGRMEKDERERETERAEAN